MMPPCGALTYVGCGSRPPRKVTGHRWYSVQKCMVVSRGVGLVLFLLLLNGCAHRSGHSVPIAPPSTPSSPLSTSGASGSRDMRQAHAGSTTGPLTSAPFKHLASAMAYDCIKSATDPDIARATVYLRCVGAQTALLNSKAPQRYADDNAVTASILEIYAAYALRQSSP